jgi:hypothetical protein
MRTRFCISLFILGLCSLACSSKATKKNTLPPQTTGTDTSTETDTTTDTDAGDIDAGNTSNCEAWPSERLAPLVGPFFYGNSPRPCRVKNTAQNTSLYFQYRDNGQLDSLVNPAANDQTKYEYNGDGLIGTATRTQPSGTSVTTYLYGADSVTLTTVSGGATSTQTYKLDAKGYPTVVTLDPPQEGQPVRFVHEYDSCRIVRRAAYNSDGSVNDQLTADCDYEESTGHMKGRHSPLDDQNYYYLDDDGNCVAAQ